MASLRVAVSVPRLPLKEGVVWPLCVPRLALGKGAGDGSRRQPPWLWAPEPDRVPPRLQGAQPRHQKGGENRKGVLEGAGACDIELGQEGWRQFVFIISFNN